MYNPDDVSVRKEDEIQIMNQEHTLGDTKPRVGMRASCAFRNMVVVSFHPPRTGASEPPTFVFNAGYHSVRVASTCMTTHPT